MDDEAAAQGKVDVSGRSVSGRKTQALLTDYVLASGNETALLTEAGRLGGALRLCYQGMPPASALAALRDANGSGAGHLACLIGDEIAVRKHAQQCRERGAGVLMHTRDPRKHLTLLPDALLAPDQCPFDVVVAKFCADKDIAVVFDARTLVSSGALKRAVRAARLCRHYHVVMLAGSFGRDAIDINTGMGALVDVLGTRQKFRV